MSHTCPKKYWTYVFFTAVYLINRLPTAVLAMDSPYHKLFDVQSNYTKLQVYGCLCFLWLRPYNKHKLQDRSTPCDFLGYSPTQSAYLCLQPSTGIIYVSRHVCFDESVFPFAQTKEPTSPLPATLEPIPIHEPLSTKINVNHPPTQAQPLVEQTGSSSFDSNLQVQSPQPAPSMESSHGDSTALASHKTTTTSAAPTSPAPIPSPQSQDHTTTSSSTESARFPCSSTTTVTTFHATAKVE